MVHFGDVDNFAATALGVADQLVLGGVQASIRFALKE
jgi:hypothetical protein